MPAPRNESPRRRFLAGPAAVTVALAVVSAGVLAPTVVAGGSPSDDPTDSHAAATIPSGATALVEELDERLVDTPITDGPAAAAIDALASVEEQLAGLLDASADLQGREAQLQEAIDELTDTERAAAAELAEAIDRKRRLAAAAYTQDPAATSGYAILDASGPVEVARRGRLADSVGDTLNTAAHDADDLRAAASEGATKVGDELAALRAQRAELDDTIADTIAHERRLATSWRRLSPPPRWPDSTSLSWSSTPISGRSAWH